jgi:hypothetical protein
MSESKTPWRDRAQELFAEIEEYARVARTSTSMVTLRRQQGRIQANIYAMHTAIEQQIIADKRAKK